MISDGIQGNGFGHRRSPRIVLTVPKVREIFVSTKEAKVLAEENGVDVSAIRRIWDRSRWGEYTLDLDRPKTQSLDCSVYVDEPPASVDESREEPPEVVQADCLTWRLAPSGQVAIAEIRRRGQPTHVLPARTYAGYRRLTDEATDRGLDVRTEGDVDRFIAWVGRQIDAAATFEDLGLRLEETARPAKSA